MSKKVDSGIIGLAKRVYLKYFVGYKDAQHYWDSRYGLKLKSDIYQELQAIDEIATFESNIIAALAAHGCTSVLEIGCGRGKHRDIPGWVGLDFSINVLKQSGLKEFVYADFTYRIPLPDKSFDCVMCQSVLLHVPPSKIEFVAAEMCRVAKRLVIISEPRIPGDSKNFSFAHNFEKIFNNTPFTGKVEYIKGTNQNA